MKGTRNQNMRYKRLVRTGSKLSLRNRWLTDLWSYNNNVWYFWHMACLAVPSFDFKFPMLFTITKIILLFYIFDFMRFIMLISYGYLCRLSLSNWLCIQFIIRNVYVITGALQNADEASRAQGFWGLSSYTFYKFTFGLHYKFYLV